METRGGIRVLTLNRPDKLNAADLPMQRSLVECWQIIEEDDQARAVVLAGAGRAFCAGGRSSRRSPSRCTAAWRNHGWRAAARLRARSSAGGSRAALWRRL